MGVPTWMLGAVALVVVGAEIVLLTGALQFEGAFARNYIARIPVFTAISAYPYLVVCLLSATLFRPFSWSKWWLLPGMTLIAAASLFYRYAEFLMTWEWYQASLRGMKYINCGPPVRFVIWFLDYVGSVFVVLVATLLLGLETLLRAQRRV